VLLVLAVSGCASGRTRRDAPHDAPQTYRAAVAADHAIASEAGAEILRKGGNAVDAAVATSFTLSAVRPESCGIGGGGFMIIRFHRDPKFGDTSVALNYREVAPAAVEPEYFEKLADPAASTRGGTAVAVPGTVAGLLYALEHYGSLDRATVLAPAIRAAEEGFLADESYVHAVRDAMKRLRETRDGDRRFAFVLRRLLHNGEIKAGDRVRAPEQALALRLIAERGAAAFYDGEIADEIVRTVQADGGGLFREDLRNYRVATTQPLRFPAFDRTFLGMPPPSSGGIALAQIIGIVEARQDLLGGPASRFESEKQCEAASGRPAAYLLLIVEAMKHAFADRARFGGDGTFAPVPVERLLSAENIRDMSARIDPRHTQPLQAYGSRFASPASAPAPPAPPPPPPTDHGTSHFCVIDERGNAVACTETVNLEFGSLLAVEKYGIVLNNEMDDFTTRRSAANAFGLTQSDRNLPAPGKRPLSSMSPTIVVDQNGDVELIVGASGGPKIISGTAQVMLNVLRCKCGAPDAVAARRVHHQWLPDVVEIEQRKDPPDATSIQVTAQILKEYGHTAKVTPHVVGCVQIIHRVAPGRYEAASDPRKGGQPAGTN
jgi:gamma-glutamyltranspeptidase/glutathione hydrolase